MSLFAPLQVIDTEPDDNLSDIKLPTHKERFRPRVSSLRVLGLRSGRQMKRARMYRAMSSRSASYHRKISRRNLNSERGGIYRRGLSRSSHSNFSSGENDRFVDKFTMNQLSIPHLSRDYHDEQLTCLASNNNVTSPTTAHVTVIMNCEYNYLFKTFLFSYYLIFIK